MIVCVVIYASSVVLKTRPSSPRVLTNGRRNLYVGNAAVAQTIRRASRARATRNFRLPAAPNRRVHPRLKYTPYDPSWSRTTPSLFFRFVYCRTFSIHTPHVGIYTRTARILLCYNIISVKMLFSVALVARRTLPTCIPTDTTHPCVFGTP